MHETRGTTNKQSLEARLQHLEPIGGKAIPTSVYGTLLAFTLSSGMEQWTSSGLNVFPRINISFR
jgi:hypothetical protein